MKKNFDNVVKDIQRLMVENYVFPETKKPVSENDIESEELSDDLSDLGDEIGGEESLEQEQPIESNTNPETKEKIKQIRTLALELILKLDPSSQTEEYKTIKTIWDSCDKLLSNKNAPSKNINNN